MDRTKIRFIGVIIRLCGARCGINTGGIDDIDGLSNMVIKELMEIYEVKQ